MFRLSIIIPAPGGVNFSSAEEPNAVEETLVSVLENRPAHCEVLLVSDSVYSDPYDLADEVKFVTLDANVESNGWTTLANKAIQQARGRFVHVLKPGVVVEAGWERDACDYLSRAPDVVIGVSPCVESASGKSTVGVELTARGRRQMIAARDTMIEDDRVFGPCQQASFFRRVNLIEAGGWNEAVHPQVADVELALRLNGQGMRLAHRDESVVQSTADADTNQGSDKFAIARDLEQIRRKYAAAGVIAKRGWFAAIGTTFGDSILGRLTGRFGEMPLTGIVTTNDHASEASPISRAA